MFRGAAAALGFALVCLVGGATGSAAVTQPNVVLILVDDIPAVDGRLIDALPTVRDIFAAHGVTFSDFHAETPLCCPSRMTFLTGLHTHNHHVETNSGAPFDPTTTLATKLRSAGYFTVHVGKYTNNYGSCKGANCAPNIPPGWDRFRAFLKSDYYDYDLLREDGTVERHGGLPEDYSTDVASSRAVELIESAPTTKPLFAWIAPFAPHVPTTPAPRYAGTTCSVARWKPPSWSETDVADKPAYVRVMPSARGTKGQDLTKICRSLRAVDDLVGSVRDALARSGRLSNTMFVFAGDNGMNMGEHRLVDKGSPYQTQVPFLVSWPKRLGVLPRTVGERVHNIDFAPTVCAYAGCTLGPFPGGQPGPDGVSFATLLTGPATTLQRDAVLTSLSAGWENVPGWHAVTTTGSSQLATKLCALAQGRGCRWHYIEYVTGERELYDVSGGPCWTWTAARSGDPCELRNLAVEPAYQSLIGTLRSRLASLKAE